MQAILGSSASVGFYVETMCGLTMVQVFCEYAVYNEVFWSSIYAFIIYRIAPIATSHLRVIDYCANI
jgi:hypothetical protein